MRIHWSDIFRFKYFLFLIIVVTIFYIILNPDYIYSQKEYFTQEINSLFDANSAIQLKQNQNFDILSLRPQKNYTWICYTKHGSNQLKQTEIPELTAAEIGQKSNLLFYDTDLNTINFIGHPTEKSYALVTISDKDLSINSHTFYEHEMYKELQSEYISINGKKFYHYSTAPEIKTYFLEKYRSGYRLIFGQEFLNLLKNGDEALVEEKLTDISENVSGILHKTFTPGDILKILKATERYNYYQMRIFYDTGRSKYAFSQAEILGKLDCNNDGTRDFLIFIFGTRYLYSQIICLDGLTKEIIWNKKFLSMPFDRKVNIVDVDQDNQEEILISFYSPCYEMPLEYDEQDVFGTTKRASFLVLDKSGKIKRLNNKLAAIESEPGFFYFHYAYNAKNNKVLLGLMSRYDDNIKQILNYDLNSNRIDTLKINYTNNIDIRKENDHFTIFNFEENILVKVVLDDDFNEIDRYQLELVYDVKRIFKKQVTINDVKYYVINNKEGIVLTDLRLKKAHFLEYEVIREPIQIKDCLYIITQTGPLERLKCLKIARNKEINLFLLIIILSEFLLLTFYLLLIQYLKIPLSSPKKNYFVFYSLAGRIYYCSLMGKISKNYELPRKITRQREAVEEMMSELSDRTKLIYQKKLFFLKFFVYEIRAYDELEIIRRIAHDLKNSLVLHKLVHEEFSENNDFEIYDKEFFTSFQEVSAIAQTLANFSQIDKLYLEKLDLNQVIAGILMKYENHKLFPNIKFVTDKSKCIIKLDEKLFSIALRNLLNNALQEISADQNIVISLHSFNDSKLLTITNPFDSKKIISDDLMKIGYTTKENGSGIGLPIARVIFERHGWELSYRIQQDNFIIEIDLGTI